MSDFNLVTVSSSPSTGTGSQRTAWARRFVCECRDGFGAETPGQLSGLQRTYPAPWPIGFGFKHQVHHAIATDLFVGLQLRRSA